MLGHVIDKIDLSFFCPSQVSIFKQFLFISICKNKLIFFEQKTYYEVGPTNFELPVFIVLSFLSVLIVFVVLYWSAAKTIYQIYCFNILRATGFRNFVILCTSYHRYLIYSFGSRIIMIYRFIIALLLLRVQLLDLIVSF